MAIRYEDQVPALGQFHRSENIAHTLCPCGMRTDENGNIGPDAGPLLPLIPIPYVTSEEAGWGRGLMDPSRVRLLCKLGRIETIKIGNTYGIAEDVLDQFAARERRPGRPRGRQRHTPGPCAR